MGFYQMPSFPPDTSPFFETQIYSAPSIVYCTLDHFTFSDVTVIFQINVQQYTAFETLSHVILLKQKNQKQKCTQGLGIVSSPLCVWELGKCV